MADEPAVSVVVTCFNLGAYLPDAVGSVLAQSFRDLEVVIVDDGSADDSLAVARGLEERSGEIPVHVVAQENGGPGSARNTGVAHARAPFVLLLDGDDALEPDYVETLASALAANPRAGVAYGGQRNFGDDSTFHPHAPCTLDDIAVCNRIGIASMFRREAWLAVGGLDARLGGYEDWDFWLSICERGWAAAWAPGSAFRYRVRSGTRHAGSRSKDQRLKAHVVLNHPRLYAPEQLAWAAGVLDEDPFALAVDAGMYVVPRCGPEFDLAEPDLALRDVAVLAFGDELATEPELLERWARCFDDRDPVTLVVVGGVAATDALAPAVERAGLDRDGAADVVLVPMLDRGPSAWLARRALFSWSRNARVDVFRGVNPVDDDALARRLVRTGAVPPRPFALRAAA